MGMTASQARYLALTARKTNAEYEGQQINQARTALANQSANLFNKLLRLEVPNPPKTTDYTKIQYSYNDGETSSVIDEWTQLSGTNPDYNYLVKSHYYASMYTGAVKKLTDPQVQISGNGTKIDDWSTIAAAKSSLDVADAAQQLAYKTWQETLAREEIDILNIQTEAYLNNTAYKSIDSGINSYSSIAGTGFDSYNFVNGDTLDSYNVKHFYDPDVVPTPSDVLDIQSVLQGVQDMIDTNLMDLSTLNMYLVGSGVFIDDSNIDKILEGFPKNVGDTYNAEQKAILNAFCLEEDNGISRIVSMNDINSILVDDPTGTGVTVHKHELNGTFLADTSNPSVPTLNSYAYDINTYHVSVIKTDEAAYNNAYNTYETLLNNYNNNISRPTYIGNSELTPIFNLVAGSDEETELLQIVKDMKAEKIDTDILNHFDSSGNYLGGIYSFKMNGTIYYTTQDVLKEAYEKSYPKNGSNNIIDGQYKMPYYNASYIDKRIEQTSKALVETDESGRFKSVKFDDNSIVYNLNTETVTDEAAYEDAMNRYTYEKAKYEKMIADINAKTSIIQKEDRTLELRLKQLDTEQNALKTEMDAVKKVIKDNVEKVFKTFSD